MQSSLLQQLQDHLICHNHNCLYHSCLSCNNFPSKFWTSHLPILLDIRHEKRKNHPGPKSSDCKLWELQIHFWAKGIKHASIDNISSDLRCSIFERIMHSHSTYTNYFWDIFLKAQSLVYRLGNHKVKGSYKKWCLIPQILWTVCPKLAHW